MHLLLIAQIIISSGALDLGGGPYSQGSRISLIGNRGFATTAGISAGAGNIEATRCSSLPDKMGCRPGDPLSLRIEQSDTDLSWTPLILDGNPYNLRTRNFGATSLKVVFEGAFILPPMAPTAVIITPFTFGGFFRHPIIDESNIATEILTGKGMAYIFLRQSFIDPSLWSVTRMLYLFQ